MWSNERLSKRLESIIENKRLIRNKPTRVTPFEAHSDPNTLPTNMLTKPSTNIISYNKLRNCCLDKQLLRHDVLTQEMWRRDGKSEGEMDIQNRTSD